DLFFKAEDGIRDFHVTGVQTCALPILIVDLRYNTGGYVNTAIYLNNKIINSAGNGKLMFSYEVNKNLELERKNGSLDFVPENFKIGRASCRKESGALRAPDGEASSVCT